MTQIGLYFNQERCTGCYTCSIACKDWHDPDVGSDIISGAGSDSGTGNRMRLTITERGTFPDLFLSYLVVPCYHCQDAPCIKACPENAISKTESNGVVLVDRDKCTGKDVCGMLCRKACPYNSPQFGTRENAKMQKCDFCHDRLQNGLAPVCVEACPMYALEIGPLDELRSKYGDSVEASGFRYSEKISPSVVLTPRKE